MDPKDATASAKDAVRDLGSFIREQRKAAQLSLRNLASLAGVSNPYLSQIERGLRKPSAEILQRVAEALRISAETLYVKAGILDERDDDLAARIASDTTLTEKQKRALLEVYLSFRAERHDPAAIADVLAGGAAEPDAAEPTD
jgi:transcriptional regulator with XRE-family HTH domain